MREGAFDINLNVCRRIRKSHAISNKLHVKPTKKDRKCKVYLLHGDLTEEQMQYLYVSDKINALVTTTHGEGYGLPIFDAAANGMPIIATDWSGHLDFLSAPVKEGRKTKIKKLFAKLKYELKEIPRSSVWPGVLPEGSRWANVNERSFKFQIRKVFQDYGFFKKRAEILQKHVISNYESEKILNQMYTEIFLDLEKYREKKLGQLKSLIENSEFEFGMPEREE